jgi:hypothetical protein
MLFCIIGSVGFVRVAWLVGISISDTVEIRVLTKLVSTGCG